MRHLLDPFCAASTSGGPASSLLARQMSFALFYASLDLPSCFLRAFHAMFRFRGAWFSGEWACFGELPLGFDESLADAFAEFPAQTFL